MGNLLVTTSRFQCHATLRDIEAQRHEASDGILKERRDLGFGILRLRGVALGAS